MFNAILKIAGVGGLIAAIILLVVLFPFLFIWAANTLFPMLAIPYTFETWAATGLLGMFFRGDGLSFTKKGSN